MKVPACPICRKAVSAPDARLGPFCSTRCQLVDLGRWLAEDYRVPTQEAPPGSDEHEAE